MSYDAYQNEKLGFTTRQLHAGYHPQDNRWAKQVPIYQSAAFEFGDFARCERLTFREEQGFSYSRCSNPTNKVLEERIASLEGGTAALSFASGMGAIFAVLMNLAEAGDEIITVPTMYGESVTLICDILPSMGITGRIVQDPDDISAFEALINDKTRAVYIESLGNPLINIIDFKELARIAHQHGVPLVVDNTFATPYLFRPFEFGADIVVYSATKYLGGHGTTVAGLAVEKGDFNWNNGRFPQFDKFRKNGTKNIPEEILSSQLFTLRLYQRSLSLFGAHLSAQSAFYILQGIETLSLRMERHAYNARAIAIYLSKHPKIREVSSPVLENNPYHALAEKYFPKGLTGMLSFRVRGGKAAAVTVLDNVHLFDQMVNVGDSKSLIVYPAVATHFGLTLEQQADAGIYPDTIRVSVGIEDIEDLIADLDQALAMI
ncbi:MAG TPA: aminotransferase class V-fold PLP-dependent enzyme [Lachnospiraceae bacterium]|nr:aminotransferase class V-fold PLP-dependent enzyme [Lachnospiraceae bacterium]